MSAKTRGLTLRLAGAAALGVFTGSLLRRRKDAGPAGQKADWTAGLKGEHLAIRRLLKSMTASHFNDGARRVLLVEKLVQALERHARRERDLVYPALEAAGYDQSEGLDAEHARLAAHLERLRGMAPEDPLWDRTARSLRRALERHMREEEGSTFPRYAIAMDAAQSEALAERLGA